MALGVPPERRGGTHEVPPGGEATDRSKEQYRCPNLKEFSDVKEHIDAGAGKHLLDLEKLLPSRRGSDSSGAVSAVSGRLLKYTHIPRAILDTGDASG
jgi:hypothetical protein